MKFFVMMMMVLGLSLSAQAKNTKVQKINFEETDVDGKVRQPDGSYITQKRGIEFIPLYKLKENFDEQIEESLQYVK